MFSQDIRWWKSFHRGPAEQSRFLRCRPAKEVEHPTYEVVGEIERVDQWDTIQLRTMLKDKESFEYKEYYQRHPERKDGDDKMGANLTTALKEYFKTGHMGLRAFLPKEGLGSKPRLGT